MKTQTLRLCALLTALGLFSYEVMATITITNFSLTENSVSFDISGTLPDHHPDFYLETFFFVNPGEWTDAAFTLETFLSASSFSFTGSQSLDPVYALGTGWLEEYGDYFYINFQDDLAGGESVSGNLMALWGKTAFDPTQVASLVVNWGSYYEESAIYGVYLTSVVVPEPSTFILFGLGSLAVLMVRRRHRKE